MTTLGTVIAYAVAALRDAGFEASNETGDRASAGGYLNGLFYEIDLSTPSANEPWLVIARLGEGEYAGEPDLADCFVTLAGAVAAIKARYTPTRSGT